MISDGRTSFTSGRGRETVNFMTYAPRSNSTADMPLFPCSKEAPRLKEQSYQLHKDTATYHEHQQICEHSPSQPIHSRIIFINFLPILKSQHLPLPCPFRSLPFPHPSPTSKPPPTHTPLTLDIPTLFPHNLFPPLPKGKEEIQRGKNLQRIHPFTLVPPNLLLSSIFFLVSRSSFGGR